MLHLGDSLQVVLSKLYHADLIRLSRCCKHLHNAYKLAVRQQQLSQQDLEYAECSILPGIKRLRLNQLDCGTDLADYLIDSNSEQLQQLVELQVWLPVDIDGLKTLLAACTSLRTLALRGNCSINSALTGQMHPVNLQQLALQQNSALDADQLIKWLSVTAAPQEALGLQSDSHGAAIAPVDVAGTCIHARCNGLQLQPLLPAWPNLQVLDLTGSSKLGASWSFLALCPALQQLILHSCYKVTNDTLKAFAEAVDRLRNALSSGISDCAEYLVTPGRGSGGWAGEQQIIQTARCSLHSGQILLKHLNLAYTRVSDNGMKHLAAALSGLQSLNLKGCNVGDDGLEHLLQLQGLTALNIKHCHRITEDGIQQLAALSNLSSLAYGYTSMIEADYVAELVASQFPSLTGLDLLTSELTDAGLALLGAGLQHLVQLKLYQAGITDGGLHTFAGQPAGQALHRLVLFGLGHVHCLNSLGSFPALKELYVGSLCDLTEAATGLQQLSCLTDLQQITFERMEGLSVPCLRQILLGCKQLQTLRVRGCGGIGEEELGQQVSMQAAAMCCSSATVWWAASASCDTDDEDDSWQLMPI